jgi:hypothetical protein
MRLLIWPAAQKDAGSKPMLGPARSHDLHAQEISVELGRGRRIFRVQTESWASKRNPFDRRSWGIASFSVEGTIRCIRLLLPRPPSG